MNQKPAYYDKGGYKPPRKPPRGGGSPSPGRSCNSEIAMVFLTFGLWWVVPVVRYHVGRKRATNMGATA